jgi:hypothetical protein
MAHRELLGHIDCPICGFANGVRVTEDKNGNPFAYCEGDCDQQIPIGNGAKSTVERRVQKFYAKYPHIKKAEKHREKEPPEPAVTVTESKGELSEVQEPVAVPVQIPKKSVLEMMGVSS